MAALLAAGLLLAGCASDDAEKGRRGDARVPNWPPNPAVSQIARRLAEAVNEAFPGMAKPKQARDDAAREVDQVLPDY